MKSYRVNKIKLVGWIGLSDNIFLKKTESRNGHWDYNIWVAYIPLAMKTRLKFHPRFYPTRKDTHLRDILIRHPKQKKKTHLRIRVTWKLALVSLYKLVNQASSPFLPSLQFPELLKISSLKSFIKHRQKWGPKKRVDEEANKHKKEGTNSTN